MMRLRARFVSAALVALLSLPASARKPGDPIKPGFNLFSKQQDVQLGQEAATQIRRQIIVSDNRDLQDYVTRIGQRLARQPEADNYPYTFTVVVDKNINAFALPGGPTFIYHGILLAADNEAQVAGVIAHEISHVALRHGTNQASKANLLQLPAILAGAATGSTLLAQLTQLGAVGFMLKFSRTAETQADLLGARIMSNAGYNPIEMARFFEKLEAEGGSRAPQFLSDHPNPGNRVRNVEEELRGFPRRNYDFSAGDFQGMKTVANQLPPGRGNGRSALGGGAAQPPPPSGGFKQFRGREYGLSYPDNWQVFGDADAAAVTLAPREGIVQGGRGGQVGYGAIVSHYIPERRLRDLRDTTNELIQQLRNSNPSLRLVSRDPRRTRVDASDALISLLTSNSPYGGTEVDMLLTVERPEGIFYMIFIVPDREFRRAEATFDEMVRSIRFAN